MTELPCLLENVPLVLERWMAFQQANAPPHYEMKIGDHFNKTLPKQCRDEGRTMATLIPRPWTLHLGAYDSTLIQRKELLQTRIDEWAIDKLSQLTQSVAWRIKYVLILIMIILSSCWLDTATITSFFAVIIFNRCVFTKEYFPSNFASSL